MKHKLHNCISLIAILSIFQFSCKKFLEIAPPKDSLVQQTVFNSDEVAKSAITGIYSQMASTGFASGGLRSVTSVCGLSADEYNNYFGAEMAEFYENRPTATNFSINSLWSSPFQNIYSANAIIEGLETSTGISDPVKIQLKGEALFIRAFCYFYLVNLFGDVPLHLSTDYRINQSAARTSISQIYQQIITDLKTAETLLNESYITTERVRPNKSTVQALLARVYLYTKDWANSEIYSSLVIGKTGTYSLSTLENVFLKNSSETIWQLMPSPNKNTQEGSLFIFTTNPTSIALRNDFVSNAFEVDDKRKSNWVKSFTNSSGTYYYPYKYKVQSSTTVTEYSMVFRLAEQYLIRAEARINQDKIALGIEDVNLLRFRARPLPTTTNPNPIPELSSNLNKSEALLAVEKERRVELFSEWGHRWFDLKRTNRATVILTALKTNWNYKNGLYPISQDEINRNSNILQNEGY